MSKLFPKENDTKDAVKRILDKHKWFHFSVPGSTYGSNGISDRIALKNGHMVAIEIKGPSRKATPLQKAFLDRVNAHGGTGVVVRPEDLPMFEQMLIDLTKD